MKKRMLILASAVVLVVAAGWVIFRAARRAQAGAPASAGVPTTAVKRGDVTFTVTTKGELQGGNSQMLVVPMVGGGTLAITALAESGELVEAGQVVASFDSTEQEYKLREAEADVAEAEQQVTQAQAESQAREEEARYSILQARTDLQFAEYEARKNEVSARIVARMNDLAVAAARDKLSQLEKDLPDRLATARAGIAIQQAGRMRAQTTATTARRYIESMTLRATRRGYVARQPNTDGNNQWGSYLPALQVGDMVRPGMAVAQIPDLENWEISMRISELDRGHLAVGQVVEIRVVALPGATFQGSVKTLGGTTGSFWDRYSECRATIDHPSQALRPGMSAQVRITTETRRNALWLPSQALFESGGRKFVYLQSGASFTPVDVKLVRRSESQAVVEGLREGQVVALADPEQMRKRQTPSSGALKAISR